ncbi:MAG: phosphate ABC transporter permease subunit PstC [Nitrospinae bacterium]|nr:phosphate ABC transporter permease subunit PstC [Nitrospinota bacterium]
MSPSVDPQANGPERNEGPSSDRGPAYWVCAFFACVAFGAAGILLCYLIGESLPALRSQGWPFLFGKDWFAGEKYGALPMIYGSAMATALALALALPFALGGAVFVSEFLPSRARLIVKSIMELLAGAPGIIYGLLGMSLLAPWIKNAFGLIDGNSLFAAGALLGIMVLPTVMTLSEDALRSVPAEYRENAISLGLTKTEVVFSVAVPQALPGIAGAVFLGLGRAMGETIAVLLVIGGIDRIPSPWYDVFSPGQSIPSKLGREAAESLGYGLHWNALMGLGLVLLLMTMAVAFAGNLFLRRSRP